MGTNGRQTMSLNRRVDALLELNDILVVENGLTGRQLALETLLIDPLAELILQRLNSFAKLFRDSLTLERLDIEAGRPRGEDEKHDNGDIGSGALETMIETRHGLDEHVDALVGELVSAGREEVQRLVEVEVVVAVEVAANEVVDLLFGERV